MLSKEVLAVNIRFSEEETLDTKQIDIEDIPLKVSLRPVN